MREVRGSDFSSEDLRRFFDSVERLHVRVTEPISDAARREAEAFATNPPRPTLEELRSHVDHSVAIARGWDHPDDRELMFDSAVQAFYTLSWLEHLLDAARRSGEGNPGLDLRLGVKVSFTPLFREGGRR